MDKTRNLRSLLASLPLVSWTRVLFAPSRKPSIGCGSVGILLAAAYQHRLAMHRMKKRVTFQPTAHKTRTAISRHQATLGPSVTGLYSQGLPPRTAAGPGWGFCQATDSYHMPSKLVYWAQTSPVPFFFPFPRELAAWECLAYQMRLDDKRPCLHCSGAPTLGRLARFILSRVTALSGSSSNHDRWRCYYCCCCSRVSSAGDGAANDYGIYVLKSSFWMGNAVWPIVEKYTCLTACLTNQNMYRL
ncbi:hypothetical protein BD289DRAFT_447923 [Coniella lustricola]|uniref:Uncharacterized protein n=1 Tax=Coniella lustricola TaxID=2025994 RepID=A0A2T2ZSK9_9PEZI|nr:hypothetical protein BD289DRAFT_447923 [Coniella lustricola]